MWKIIKASVRRILPSRVRAALQLLFRTRRITYTGSYRSWDDAKRDATGYHDPAILERVRNSALAVKEGRAAFEIDSLAVAKPEFRWQMLASILWAALQKKASGGAALHILDFGGSLGSVYFQHRAALETIPGLMWSIVEQPHFVRCGNAEFADERLHYFDTIAEANRRAPIDAALFSGVLGHVDRPYEILAEVAALGVGQIIVDQQHLIDGDADQFKLQHIKPPLFAAKLAVRFVARGRLLAHLDSLGYAPFAAWSMGFCFQRKPDLR